MISVDGVSREESANFPQRDFCPAPRKTSLTRPRSEERAAFWAAQTSRYPAAIPPAVKTEAVAHRAEDAFCNGT